MMKKIVVLALSLMLVLCAVSALAEDGMQTLNVNESFEIRSVIPEGYTFELLEKEGLNIIGWLNAGKDRPVVTFSIAYSEEHADVERFNDLDEEAVELIRESFREMDDVTFEDAKTAYDTRLLRVNGDGFVDIYTIYKGYELEFVMTPGEGQELTEEAVAKMIQFISDMEFVPVA